MDWHGVLERNAACKTPIVWSVLALKPRNIKSEGLVLHESANMMDTLLGC